jgi:hypothetical protein
MKRKKSFRRRRPLSEEAIQELAKVAFSNILDFARFESDGSVHIFDWEKALEIGAKVSVKTRRIGRGKNAREVRVTKIRMPDKFPALLKLCDHFFPAGGAGETA